MVGGGGWGGGGPGISHLSIWGPRWSTTTVHTLHFACKALQNLSCGPGVGEGTLRKQGWAAHPSGSPLPPSGSRGSAYKLPTEPGRGGRLRARSARWCGPDTPAHVPSG